MTDSTPASTRSTSIVSILSVVVGVLVFGLGVLLLPDSRLGGAWIAAIGLSMMLSGLLATEWVGDRVGLSAASRHRLSLAFSLVAVVLLVAFVVVNG